MFVIFQVIEGILIVYIFIIDYIGNFGFPIILDFLWVLQLVLYLIILKSNYLSTTLCGFLWFLINTKFLLLLFLHCNRTSFIFWHIDKIWIISWQLVTSDVKAFLVFAAYGFLLVFYDHFCLLGA